MSGFPGTLWGDGTHEGHGRPDMPESLRGRVALVAGATRGAGRGIAVELGAAGATVYVTGRSTRAHRSEYDRPETIEDTADLVTGAGGEGIAVPTDHLDPAQVRTLVDRIADERGRFDVLVNDVWGGEHLFAFDTPCGSTTSTTGCACCGSRSRPTPSPATTPCPCCCGIPAAWSSR